MKKIGILFGQENTFPAAFVDRINMKKEGGIFAEFVKIDKVMQGEPTDYAVIIDRISQEIPFYRGYLKNAALCGTAVVNNPFWWSADEKFFNNALATRLGIAVPKTVLLPSNQHPPGTTSQSMRNLAYPLDWVEIFNYVGFPAYMKPFIGGWKNVFKLTNSEEFFQKYNETGQMVMMLQEEIRFTDYFRCYCIDLHDVHIMHYDPRNPSHLRYIKDPPPVEVKLLERMKNDVRILNTALGYDFNSVEFAVHDGVPYAIDFCNPAPDVDLPSIGQENFDWVVDAAVRMAIRKAGDFVQDKNNLTWGKFLKTYIADKGY